MNYDVRQEAALKIVGIATRTANSRSHEIGALWEKFYKTGVAEQIPARLDGDIYSVYSEYESDFTGLFTVLIGCAVPEGVPVSPGLSQKTIHAASYAVFELWESCRRVSLPLGQLSGRRRSTACMTRTLNDMRRMATLLCMWGSDESDDC
jgi:predicted transcriptional regulator YdeE